MVHLHLLRCRLTRSPCVLTVLLPPPPLPLWLLVGAGQLCRAEWWCFCAASQSCTGTGPRAAPIAEGMFQGDARAFPGREEGPTGEPFPQMGHSRVSAVPPNPRAPGRLANEEEESMPPEAHVLASLKNSFRVRS
jgi:hypothetical protein